MEPKSRTLLHAALIAATAVLVFLLLGALAAVTAPEARAAPAPFTASTTGRVVDYFALNPPPAGLVYTWELGQAPPQAGAVTLTANCFDCENAGEGSLEVGPCGPYRFPLAADASRDGKVTELAIGPPGEGGKAGPIPAICFRQNAELVWHLDPAGGQGYRIEGLTAVFPADPAPLPVRRSWEGELQARGMLPTGCTPTWPPRVVPYSEAGWLGQAAVCLNCTNGAHYPVATSAATLAPWLRQVLAGTPATVKPLPGACPRAWAACWPQEQPACLPDP